MQTQSHLLNEVKIMVLTFAYVCHDKCNYTCKCDVNMVAVYNSVALLSYACIDSAMFQLTKTI